MRGPGFTLAELLISLAILGMVTTFTIPKVLSAQRDGYYNAAGKEAAAAVSGAYEAYKLHHSPGIHTFAPELTPYLNYVKVITSGDIDESYGKTGTKTCGVFDHCLLLHNGGILLYADSNHFGSASNTDYLWLFFDPDGRVTSSGTTDGPGKSLDITLYYNGRVSLQNYCQEGDTIWYSYVSNDWCPSDNAVVPTWFNWN